MTDTATPLTLEQRVATLEALVEKPKVTAPAVAAPVTHATATACPHCAAMQAKLNAAKAVVAAMPNSAVKVQIQAHLG
jgi:hypothetical protein